MDAWLICGSAVSGDGFLASERSDLKHKFHVDYVRSINGMLQPYFIGLSWYNNEDQYLWSETAPNDNWYLPVSIGLL